ncbi:MAG: pyrimidine 5'-nucleotidase [Hyphomicrobiales bacterium]|nr:pyrimidine 5'-nucleotidase [Hyphomicrobiales bacterium]MDE2017955.1 pyrimidine 5'-nucleotidase [Hyphomicrobiales bacterium]
MKRRPAEDLAPAAAVAADGLARFDVVDAWVFDLDDTLYPTSAGLGPQIDMRITQWVADYLGVDGLSARALQKHWYATHGTTLAGLVESHAIDPTDFLEFAHSIDRDGLAPDPALAAAISALPGRRMILTNGSRAHAFETARRLGLDGLFEDAYDIVALGCTPKHRPEGFARFVAASGVVPARAALFDDLPRNLATARAAGMATALVTAPGAAATEGESFDAVTSDLADLVSRIARRRSARKSAA